MRRGVQGVLRTDLHLVRDAAAAAAAVARQTLRLHGDVAVLVADGARAVTETRAHAAMNWADGINPGSLASELGKDQEEQCCECFMDVCRTWQNPRSDFGARPYIDSADTAKKCTINVWSSKFWDFHNRMQYFSSGCH